MFINRKLNASGARYGWLMRVGRRELLWAALALSWLLVVGLGERVLLSYSNTSGVLATPPVQWPAKSAIKPPADRAHLIIFAHPQCPCTHATINELATIMANSGNNADAYVVFIAPRTQGREWVRSSLWQDAEAIPGVHVMEDEDGNEARRFGALTSGQLLLYDAGGQLLFNGGITASRGHDGSNYGTDTIIAIVEGRTRQRKKSPVFGCSLRHERS